MLRRLNKRNGFLEYIKKNIPYEWEETLLKFRIKTDFCKCVYCTVENYYNNIEEISDNRERYNKIGKMINSILHNDDWIKSYIRINHAKNMRNIIEYHRNIIEDLR